MGAREASAGARRDCSSAAAPQSRRAFGRDHTIGPHAAAGSLALNHQQSHTAPQLISILILPTERT
jgi:hypothetical protein